MFAGQPPGDHSTERHVLRNVPRKSDEVAIDRESHDPHSPIPLLGGLPRLTKADDIDLVSRGEKGVALPADAGISGEDGVDDDHYAPHPAHFALTSSHRTSFSARDMRPRSSPRSAASSSTPR